MYKNNIEQQLKEEYESQVRKMEAQLGNPEERKYEARTQQQNKDECKLM